MMNKTISHTNRLSKGWKYLKLREVVSTLESGKRPKGGVQGIETGIPSLGAEHLNLMGGFKFEKIKFVPKEFADQMKKGVIRTGDVIVVKDGATTGKTSYVGNDFPFGFAVINEHVFIVRFNEEILPKYGFYRLFSSQGQKEILLDFRGAAQGGISSGFIDKVNIPFPPLPTQQVIVSKIEELFSELDKGIEQLKTAQQQLKTYRQAVLKWAFEGRLTNENVKEGELPEGWEWVRIGEICKSIVPNRDKPKSFSGDINWITTPNLSENSVRLNYENVKLGLSLKEVEEYNARVIPINSVIMTCVGTFGLSAIVERPIVINQQLHAFITNEKVSPKYLAYCIQLSKQYFESKSTSTTIQYLNKENCNSMPFPLCTIEEQTQIVSEIESRLSKADKMDESISQSLQQAEALRQSILKRAFEGKLI